MATFEPIGVIRTPFRDRYAAPRQPGVGDPAAGIIELLPGRNFEQALEDLEGFEKIWLIYHFDRNPNLKPKVLPPRGRTKRGVFATRSPHRPNAIGLSLVSLERISGLQVFVTNVDLLDETPILDIKPYLPEIEAFPSARQGWLGELEEQTWQVSWSPSAVAQLVSFGEDGEELHEYVNRVLGYDPAPHPYRRTKRSGDAFELALREWRVDYSIESDNVVVNQVHRMPNAG